MALRKRKPTSPGRRFQTVSDFKEITKDTPEKSLLAPKHNTGGRNNYGRKTMEQVAEVGGGMTSVLVLQFLAGFDIGYQARLEVESRGYNAKPFDQEQDS